MSTFWLVPNYTIGQLQNPGRPKEALVSFFKSRWGFLKFPTELSIEIEAFKKSRVPLPTASGRDLIVATRKTYSEGKRDVARASPRFKFQCSAGSPAGSSKTGHARANSGGAMRRSGGGCAWSAAARRGTARLHACLPAAWLESSFSFGLFLYASLLCETRESENRQ